MRSSFLDATVTNRECNVEMRQVSAVTKKKIYYDQASV